MTRVRIEKQRDGKRTWVVLPSRRVNLAPVLLRGTEKSVLKARVREILAAVSGEESAGEV